MARHSASDVRRVNDLFSRMLEALESEQIPAVDDLVAMDTLAWNYLESSSEQLKGLRNKEKKSSTDYSTEGLIDALKLMMKGEWPAIADLIIAGLKGYLNGEVNASGVFGIRPTKVIRGQSWQLDDFINQFISECLYKSDEPIISTITNHQLSKTKDTATSVYTFCAELAEACLDKNIDSMLPHILGGAGISHEISHFKQLAQILCDEISYLQESHDEAHDPQTLRSVDRWYS